MSFRAKYERKKTNDWQIIGCVRETRDKQLLTNFYRQGAIYELGGFSPYAPSLSWKN